MGTNLASVSCDCGAVLVVKVKSKEKVAVCLCGTCGARWTLTLSKAAK